MFPRYLPKILLLTLLLCSCGKSNETITRSFYYWKSNFQLGADGNKMLSDLHVKKIYIKFFDVDVFEDNPLPKSTLHVLDTIPAGIEVVPVVFITNATMNRSEYEIGELANNIARKIKGIQNCFTKLTPISEIQFDCDWTQETKDTYFSFLSKMATLFDEPVRITATIRLHQVKYFNETGVPPVSRGTLMFYNMGDLNDMNGGSSIFNKEDASKYLVNFDTYPIKLDVALPVFSWVVIFRNGKVNGIINDYEDDLANNPALAKEKDDLYVVKSNLRYRDVLLAPGDHLKFEKSGPEEALSAAELIRPHLAKDSITVTLFDFDYKNLSQYETRSIEKVYSRF